MRDAELVEFGVESVIAELPAVVPTHTLRVPSALRRSLATRCASLEQNRTSGFRGVTCNSAQVKLEAASIAVYCQTTP